MAQVKEYSGLRGQKELPKSKLNYVVLDRAPLAKGKKAYAGKLHEPTCKQVQTLPGINAVKVKCNCKTVIRETK